MIVCPPKGQWDSFAIVIKMKGVGRIAAKAISFWFVASCFDPKIMKYPPLDIYRSFITLHHIFIITKHKNLCGLGASWTPLLENLLNCWLTPKVSLHYRADWLKPDWYSYSHEREYRKVLIIKKIWSIRFSSGNLHPAHAGWGLNVKSQLLSKSRTASFNLPQVRGTSWRGYHQTYCK